ncbi:glucosamine-6-phosphate deaminase [Occultella glacieicola]|uniref:Glucosamine-6-phosphate deaminase n=1 Tax=Occultella glacieicola TaxID=2518684 RepID=A0ABY2E5G3_9MICO|nr:6-phosphogluconolactonase [Occultella glacieicola]TDE94750.1 glucosamine-6-phosphate deaminase [Occultella glacieicola]
MSEPIQQFVAGELPVEVYASEREMGAAAAARAAAVIRDAVAANGHARVVIATGNSQFAFVEALKDQDVPWGDVTAFHMDEYVGIDEDHTASFRRWIGERIEQPFAPAKVEYIIGDAPDAQQEADRYEALLREKPLDLVCMGIGENGHLAFNEPYDADFEDERWARVITLTPESVQQQIGEGHFPDEASTPKTAISLTIPALLSASHVQVCAPEARKAEAVARALSDEVSTACPATKLRESPNARLFLEPASASLIAARA